MRYSGAVDCAQQDDQNQQHHDDGRGNDEAKVVVVVVTQVALFGGNPAIDIEASASAVFTCAPRAVLVIALT